MAVIARAVRAFLLAQRVDALLQIAWTQRQTIHDQQQVIRAYRSEIGRLKLEYSRWGLSIIEQFLIQLDKPEEEEILRDTLKRAIVDMADEVARIEEHATT